MIIRIWHGWTKPENADAYETLLREEIFPGIAAKGVRGYRGVELLRSDSPDEVEFTTVMRFDSLEAVVDFVGDDYERAYVPASARAVLSRFDERAQHYERREHPGDTGHSAILEAGGFRRVPLSRTGVGHFEVTGTLNGHPVRVLIDTGAASTVASLSRVRELGLDVQPLANCGAGAGAGNLQVFQVDGAELRLGDVVPKLAKLLAMDLAHVDEALAQRGVAAVDVILGVDVFDAHAAIIDYGSSSLFLRDR
jgi:heme-degrading monooxygenase HmoA